MNELRYAWRGLWRTPTVTAVAVLSLALGIGASTAIFSVTNAVILRSLPVNRPEDLVMLRYVSKKGNIFDSFAYSDYLVFRDTPGALAGLAAVFSAEVNVSSDLATERLQAQLVSGNYFPLLGAGARIGRTIGPDDDRKAGGHPVCMIGYSLWQRRYGSSPSVAGQSMDINGRPYTIVGVAAEGFHGTEQGREPQVYIPLMMSAQVLSRPVDEQVQPPFLKWTDWLQFIGRRQPGVSVARAEAVLDARFEQLELAHRDTTFEMSSRHGTPGTRSRLQVVGGRQGFDGLRFGYERPLRILLVLVGLLLSIACANVANLLLARATGRRKETAIRMALGGGPWALIRQLLAESVLLAAAGAACGLLLSVWISDLLLRTAFIDEAHIDVRPDLTVVGFLLGVTCLTTLLFGLAPALSLLKASVAPALKSEGGGAGKRRGVLGGALVVVQVTLSVTLLAGAGLLLRSLHNLESIQTGFRPQNVVLASLNPGANHYSREQSRTLFMALMERAEAIPGVQAVSASLVSPLSGALWLYSVEVPGYQAARGETPMVYFNAIGPAYFASLGVAMKQGREFTRVDRGDAPPVAVVNEEMARKFW
ncbi:MAG TPA: ABC transporter permease, partial [Bryobacteraceae bacterium]